MKIPAKFKNLIEALESGLMEYSDWTYYQEMEQRGIKRNEVDECWNFLDYLYTLDEIPEQKTCYIKYITDEEQYYGAVCSVCNFELSKYMDDYGSIDLAYCPNCGAKVVK